MIRSSLIALAVFLFKNVQGQQFVMYTPGDDDTAVERFDAILSPGHISQHVHQIFGASGMSPEQSYQSLQSSACTTVADASNRGNADDHSVYWHPALYMEASNGTGYIRVPTNGHKLYYKNAGSPDDKLADPFEFPKGFRMLAGNPFMRAAATSLQRQNITQWICHSDSGMNQGTAGGFPNGVTDCDAVDGFNGAVHFPHCWNGHPFDPENPTGHMTYPIGDIEEGVCPMSHPTRLPHIFAENNFNIHEVVDQVKPDTFVLAQGDNTGYGWHFDFYNGWISGAIPALLDQCPQGQYGNEDIGTCPNFNASTVPADSCKLKVTYHEQINHPGKFLPGCNPVIDSNPAPQFDTAPIGVSTDQCNSASSNNTSPYSAPLPSHTSTSATTFTTSIVHSTATPTHRPSTGKKVHPYSPSAKIICPDANNALYAAQNGQVFLVECGIDHVAGDLSSTSVNGLAECIAACATTFGCIDVSMSGVACYMKSSLGAALPDADVWGAKLVSH